MNITWKNETAFVHWETEAGYWMGNYVSDVGNSGHYTDINYNNL